MKVQLLPPIFKKLASTIVSVSILAFLLEYTGLILDYFKMKNHIDQSAQSFILPGEYIRFTFLLDQIIPFLLIIGLFLFIFSRSPIEDEWINQKRLISYKIAFFSIPVLTIISLKYDSSVLIFFNLILVGLIQISSFVFMVKVRPYFVSFFDEK